MGKYLLGLDNGGTVTKGAIFDYNGNEIAVSSRKSNMLFPHAGFTEKNPEEFWDANINAIRDVIASAKVDPADITALAVTGYGNGMILLGEDGYPVYDCIVSTDSRAKDYVLNWYADGTYDEVYEISNQTIWPGQPVALLAWFRDNMPQVPDKAKWVMLCQDYIRYRLTGEVFAEITGYSGTNTVSLKTRQYDERLFRKFGIEKYIDRFPPLKDSSDICGYVTEEAAALTGLKAGTPVAGGLFDIHACHLASGVIDDKKLSIIAGTWSINEYVATSPVMDKDLFMNSISCLPGKYLASEGNPTSASNLDWFVQEMMAAEKAEFSARGENIYHHLDKVVDKIDVNESNVIFLPALFGSNSNPYAKGCLMNMESWHKRDHIVRAFYEGIVFSSRYNFEKLEKHIGTFPIGAIAGGPSRSRVWVQIFSDVMQMPLEVISSKELGALGAAICAGVGTGVFKSFEDAVKSMVRVSYICYPDKSKAEAYQRKYNEYKKVLKFSEALGGKPD